MSRAKFKPWSPRQPYLFAPSPQEWVPEDHLVHFLIDVVEQLDLTEIEGPYLRRDPRGSKAYHPAMMVSLLLFSYCRGVMSSRAIARATYEDVATRYLVADQHPHFTSISNFRRDHLPALAKLFAQVLNLCRAAGLARVGHVALDGTKIQASASKHKAMSHKRMEADVARLQQEIDALLKKAQKADDDEDERLGVGQDEVDIPAELQRREARLAKIQQAKADLEAEAVEARADRLREQAAVNERRAQSEPGLTPKHRRSMTTRAANQRKKAEDLAPSRDDDDDDPGALPTHRPPTTVDGKPTPKAQRNFTDPDSRIMVDGQGAFTQSYNAQAVVNDEQVIVAATLSNQAPDAQYLIPTLMAAASLLGERPERLTADSGYWSAANAAWCEAEGIDAYIATGRHRRSAPTQAPSEPSTAREKMKAKLRTPEGDATYRRRKSTVEPVFGQIKEARGFRRFLLRGLDKARGEWALVCTTHNLLKLFRAGAMNFVPA